MRSGRTPLGDLRVVELTSGHGAASLLCTLLSDLGSRVDRIAAHPWSTANQELLEAALRVAAIVVTDTDGYVRLQALRGDIPGPSGQVKVCLSPFGMSGPLAGRQATELTLEAIAGFLLANGNEGDPPRPSHLPIAQTTAALAGLTAVIAGLLDPDVNERAVVDIAELDVLTTYVGTLLPSVAATGRDPRRIGNRHGMAAPWNVYPTTDAPVMICTMGDTMWRRLTSLMDCPELADVRRFRDTNARVANVEDLDEHIGGWTSRFDSTSLIRLLTTHHIPAATIQTADEVRTHLRSRSRRLTIGGQNRLANPLASLLPSSGTAESKAPTSPGTSSGQPLSNVRVVELGAYTAGPMATKLLASLGADVLKVEPPQGEGSRRLAQQVGGVGQLFFVNNAGKRSCRLALDDHGDTRQLERILDSADILLTNLSSDVIRAAGLDPSRVLRDHALAYCQLSGYGRDVDLRAFDTIVQASAGAMRPTDDGSEPMKTAVSLADVAGAYLAAAASLVAVRQRRETGRGQLVDVALYDAAAWITLTGAASTRRTNWLVDSIVKTADGYVTVAGQDADSLRRFGARLGTDIRPETAVTDLELALGHLASADVLDAGAHAGIAVARVEGVSSAVAHPHVAARGMIHRHEYQDSTILVTGTPFRWIGRQPPPSRQAPVEATSAQWEGSTHE